MSNTNVHIEEAALRSKAAEESVLQHHIRQQIVEMRICRLRVLKHLVKCGSRGATAGELEQALGLSNQAIRSILRSLTTQRLICKTAEVRPNPQSSRLASVYESAACNLGRGLDREGAMHILAELIQAYSVFT